MYQKLINLALSYDVTINEAESKLLIRYMDLLLEYNSKFNLTSITDPEEVLEKHFLDSLVLLKYWKPEEGKKVIDLGTGGGIPGVPLAICFPKTNFYLVDSINKKISFLEVVKDELKLDNIYPAWIRAEDLAKRARASFDVVIARAVAHIGTLMEYSFPLLKVGGVLIAMKGPSAKNEILEADIAFKELSGKLTDLYNIALPTAGERNIAIIKKIKKTHPKYPRNSGIIKKNPLYVKIDS